MRASVASKFGKRLKSLAIAPLPAHLAARTRIDSGLKRPARPPPESSSQKELVESEVRDAKAPSSQGCRLGSVHGQGSCWLNSSNVWVITLFDPRHEEPGKIMRHDGPPSRLRAFTD